MRKISLAALMATGCFPWIPAGAQNVQTGPEIIRAVRHDVSPLAGDSRRVGGAEAAAVVPADRADPAGAGSDAAIDGEVRAQRVANVVDGEAEREPIDDGHGDGSARLQ